MIKLTKPKTAFLTALLSLSAVAAMADGYDGIYVWNGATDYVNYHVSDGMRIAVGENKATISVGGVQKEVRNITDGNKLRISFGTYSDAKAEAIVLTDATAYTNNQIKSGVNVDYVRNFKNTKWQALYVPFTMSYEDWEDNYEVAKICNFHGYDTNNDGVNDTWQLEIDRIKSGTLLPNHPYLIKAKATGEQTLSIKNTTLYAVAENSIDCSSVESKYSFVGTYHNVTGMKTEGYYFLSGGSLCIAASDATKLSPYRWYMTMESRGSQVTQASQAKPAVIELFVIGEDEEVTGTSIVESQPETQRTVIYDLLGRRMNVSDVDQLPSGTYIVNGKKTIVR